MELGGGPAVRPMGPEALPREGEEFISYSSAKDMWRMKNTLLQYSETEGKVSPPSFRYFLQAIGARAGTRAFPGGVSLGYWYVPKVIPY